MSMVRLDKFLANAGKGTRTEVKSYIRKGQVTVNDIIIKSPEHKIDENEDHIICCQEEITCQHFEYYMFHKPSGCVTATYDGVHETVMDYITSKKKDELFPVGRLDRDTEGLLLITNDGALAHELLSPRKHVEKTYYAIVEGIVTKEDAVVFAEGVDIGEPKKTLPAKLEIIKSAGQSEVLLTICEGKFHQVKRMFEAVGKSVGYLKRMSMGGLTLDESLEKGSFRALTEEELALLKTKTV